MAAVAQPKGYIESNPGVNLEFKFCTVHVFRHIPRPIDESASTHPEVSVHVPGDGTAQRPSAFYGLGPHSTAAGQFNPRFQLFGTFP